MIRTYDIATGELIHADTTGKTVVAATFDTATVACPVVQLLQISDPQPGITMMPADLATVAIEPFLQRQR